MVKSYRLSYLIRSALEQGKVGFLRRVNRVIVEFTFARSKKTARTVRIEIPIENTTTRQTPGEFGFLLETSGEMMYSSASNLFKSTKVTRGFGCTNPSRTSLRVPGGIGNYLLSIRINSVTAPVMARELASRPFRNCNVQSA